MGNEEKRQVQIFGCVKGSDSPQVLEEVSLLVDRESLLDIARFLLDCHAEMGRNPDWDHAHFGSQEGGEVASAGIVVVAAKPEYLQST